MPTALEAALATLREVHDLATPPLSASISLLRNFKQRNCLKTEYAKRGENDPCAALNELDWIFVQLVDGNYSRLVKEAWGHKPEHEPVWPFGGLGAQVGGVAGGLAAGAAVTAAGAPELAPIAAPIGAAAGAEAGKLVETQVVPAVSKAFGDMDRRARYGALTEYGALFLGRESATNLARLYQKEGVPAFVYFDPAACRPIPTRQMLERFREEAKERFAVERTPEEIAEAAEAEAAAAAGEERPVLGPVATQECGMWRVEVGEPSPIERSLAPEVHVVHPGARVPSDPRRRFFLEFPTQGGFGAMADRPSLLDALVDFGAILIPGGAPQSPCDCVALPSGKELCTREGAIGILSQDQVKTSCSEIRVVANGRVERAQKLHEAQELCTSMIGDLPRGERFGARFTCLSELLREPS